MVRIGWVAIVALGAGCVVGDPAGGGGDDGGDDDAPATPDAGVVVDPCATPVAVPTSGRPVDVMPPARLAEIAARLPCIAPGPLREVLESPDAIWYDRASLVPGYQDSFGDNVIAPIGMRPNTIDPGMIDVAVPGGHAQVFREVGTFHFPFGDPIGPVEDVVVVDVWWTPRRDDQLLPVVWWRRDPNELTHRYEWMFPAGTVFAELLFLDDGELWPFEIRTRTREVAGWRVDAYRPFAQAEELAAAIDARRGERPEWASDAALDALVAHLRDPGTLAPARVAAPQFPGALPARDGWIDALPAQDGAAAAMIRELLVTTPFRSARGVAWKRDGAKVASAAGAAGPGSIVPAGYNGGVIEVSEASCEACHRDAGRPFQTWYDNITAYGELWGNDEVFTWHPFAIEEFVDASGAVVNFNYDNRVIRDDLAGAGLVAPYDPGEHSSAVYGRIVREWTDFAY